MTAETARDTSSEPVSPALGARPAPRASVLVVLLGLLYTGTGFVGLVVEQVFEKLLGTLVGASTPAAATVLAAYFAGLTLGALSYERLLRPWIRNPIRVYALLEGGVAVSILAIVLLFDLLLPLFAPLLAAARSSFALLQITRLLVAALWIVPPTFLMGASLPAIGDSLAALRLPSPPRLLAIFYALNLAGAILGASLAAYAIFPLIGLDGALAACAAIGLTVLLIALRLSRAVAPGHDEASAMSDDARVASAPRGRALILALAFASGFLFFGLEVLWVHLLAAVIGNSVYAFATMLTVVLIGLALGSAAIAVLAPRGRPTSMSLTGTIMVAGGAALAVTHGFWPGIPHALATSGGEVETFAAAELLRFRFAFVQVILPATALGMLFPSLFTLRDFPAKRFGDFVGRTYAANAVGCIVGALATTFVLLPRFGSERLLAISAALLLVGGGLILARQGDRWWVVVPAVAAGAAAIVWLPEWDRLSLTSGEHVYFRRLHVTETSALRFFHEDTAGGITTVVARPGDGAGGDGMVRTLLTNGKFQGNDSGERDAQAAFAMIPAMMLQRFDHALVIGAGTGATASVVHLLDFEEVRVAEIAGGIIDAGRQEFSHLNRRVFDEPNVTVELEDGRNLLLLDRQTYDLITIEISSIWFANSTNLYSREFYQLARARLREGGVLQQWVQLHHIGVEDVVSVIATMRSVFPHVSLWVAGGQGILVGADEPQLIRASALRQMDRLREQMGWSAEEFSRIMRGLITGQLLSPSAIDRLFAAKRAVINTDRNRFLEYSTPRYNLDDAATTEAMIESLAKVSDGRFPAAERDAAAMLR
jgi:spermidine synthase